MARFQKDMGRADETISNGGKRITLNKSTLQSSPIYGVFYSFEYHNSVSGEQVGEVREGVL